MAVHVVPPLEVKGIMRNAAREAAAVAAARFIRERLGWTEDDGASVGIILGTGWGDAIELTDKREIPLADIPGFAGLAELGTVSGHNRTLVSGRLGEVHVIALSGRIHMNEDPSRMDIIVPMVRLETEMLIHLGINVLILTCAAGSLCWPIEVGDVVVIRDFVSPLGTPSTLYAGEFVSPEDALDYGLATVARTIETPLRVCYGTYAMVLGPGLEGRAHDKRILASAGANVVGMSVIPEAAVAALYARGQQADAPLRVATLALALVTNDSHERHDHEKVRRRAQEQKGKLAAYLTTLVAEVNPLA